MAGGADLRDGCSGCHRDVFLTSYLNTSVRYHDSVSISHGSSTLCDSSRLVFQTALNVCFIPAIKSVSRERKETWGLKAFK